MNQTMDYFAIAAAVTRNHAAQLQRKDSSSAAHPDKSAGVTSDILYGASEEAVGDKVKWVKQLAEEALL
ncbi:MAG TPA: hypothetical protein VJM76_02365 [Gammaproteobacteria bacterium]|nr:hypothetical protein [Gammaproteobacteria bacterium]